MLSIQIGEILLSLVAERTCHFVSKPSQPFQHTFNSSATYVAGTCLLGECDANEILAEPTELDDYGSQQLAVSACAMMPDTLVMLSPTECAQEKLFLPCL